MAVGEITRDGYAFLAVKGLSKTGGPIVKGNVYIFDTDGWFLAGDAAVGPHGVALKSVIATAGQVEAVIMLRGCVIVPKADEAQYQGQSVKWNAVAAALLTEDKDNLQAIIGTVLADVIKAATTTEILLLQ